MKEAAHKQLMFSTGGGREVTNRKKKEKKVLKWYGTTHYNGICAASLCYMLHLSLVLLYLV
jgi:hypothetical protein